MESRKQSGRGADLETSGSFSTAVERLRELGEGAELVSGIQSTDDGSWRHVWVEQGDLVHDFVNGRALTVGANFFHTTMRVTDAVRVPGAEVLAVLGALDRCRLPAAKRLVLRLMRRLHVQPPASLLSGLWHR